MQLVVNQIYWAPTFDSAFAAGSEISRQADGTVIFKNPFMTSGVTIISWTVSANYQGSKTVPQLPHLHQGHQYRLVFHGIQEPQGSVIIRITFFDVQWQKIKSYDSTSKNVYFTVPEGTVNYNLELINAGNRRLVFHRIDLCENRLPEEANDDLWFHQRYHADVKQPLMLLVAQSGVRAQKEYPAIAAYADQLQRPVQLVTISHQYQGSVIDDLVEWLRHQRQTSATLVACQPTVNETLLAVQQKLPALRTMLASTQSIPSSVDRTYHFSLPSVEWHNPSLVDPNWPVIFQAITEMLGGE